MVIRVGKFSSGGTKLETRIRYREQKPRSDFGIGIGAEFFFSKTSNSSHVSHFFLGDTSFYKLGSKVNIHKSCGEVSLVVQDTIELCF